MILVHICTLPAVMLRMVTLVAFELGYLSPPVARNHLLTRQVVGEAEVLAAQQEGPASGFAASGFADQLKHES